MRQQLALTSAGGDGQSTDQFTCAGSLTENVSAIVSGKASPHGKLEYILGGISAFCLILTTIWATVIIRSPLNVISVKLPQLIPDLVRSNANSSPLQ